MTSIHHYVFRLSLLSAILLLLLGCGGQNPHRGENLYEVLAQTIGDFRGEPVDLPADVPELRRGWDGEFDETRARITVDDGVHFEEIDAFVREILGTPSRAMDADAIEYFAPSIPTDNVTLVSYHAEDLGAELSYQLITGQDRNYIYITVRGN